MPDIDIIIKATDRASGPLKDVNRELGHLDGHGRGLLGPLGSLASALGTGLVIAAGAALTAVTALGFGLKSSITAAANMEQGVADISAVMGKTAPPVEELNKLIQDLALDPKLKVNATQAAQAINMLAKNGITWEQISGGMARSTVLLANATNDDFAKAADVATDMIVNFNKEATDMEDVMNGIIGVTQQSKLDLNGYALASGQASAMAGAYGVTLEDFNAVLAATSSAFTGGSDQGTSFKVFLQRLVPDTAPATKAMRELGLITDEGGNAFFDAEGNMESFAVIAGELAKATAGLTMEQKINAMGNIFGMDAGRMAVALADASTESILNMKVAIADTSAEDAAATRMDTLKGSWEIFKGVVEALSIQLGTVFLPIVRDVVEWLTKMALEHGPKVIEWATKLAAVMGSDLPLAFEDGSGKIKQFLEYLGVSEGVAQAAGKAYDIIADVIGGDLALSYEDGSGAIKQFLEALGVSETTAQRVGLIFDTFVDLFSSDLPLALEDGSGSLKQFLEALGIGEGVALAVGKAFAIISDVISGDLALSYEDGSGAIKQFLEAMGLGETTALAVGKAFDVVADVISGDLALAYEDGSGGIKQFLEALGVSEGVAQSVGLAYDIIVDAVKAIGEWISTNIGPFVTWNDALIAAGIALAVIFGPPIIAAIAGFIAAIAPVLLLFAALTAGVALLRNAWENDWGGIKTKTLEALDAIKNRFAPLVETIKTFGGDALREIKAFVTGNETEFTALGKIWDETKKTFEGLFTDLKNTVVTAGTPVLDWFQKNFPEASAALKKAWEDVSKRFGELWKVIQEAFSGGSGNINKILVQLQAWWKEHGDEVQRIVDNFLKLTIAVISAAIQIMTNMLKLFFQIITGDWKGAWETIKDTAGIFAGLVKTIWETFVNNLKEAWKLGLGDILTNAKTKWDEIKDTIHDKIGLILSNVTEKWEKIKSTIIDRVGDILTNAREKWEQIKVAIKDRVEDILSNAKDKWEQIKVAIADKVNPILENMKTKWEAIKKVIGDRTEDILANSKTKWEEIKKAIVDRTGNILTTTTEKWELIKKAIIDRTGDISTNVTTKWGEISTTTTTKWGEISTTTSTKWTEMSTNAKTKWTEMSTTVTTKWTEISTIISTQMGIMLTNVSAKITEIVTALTSPFTGIYDKFKGFGSGAAQGLIDGIGSLIETAKSKAAELASLAAAAVGIELEAQSPSQVFYRHGEMAGQGFVNGMDSKLSEARNKAAELAAMAAQDAAAATAFYAKQNSAPSAAQPAANYAKLTDKTLAKMDAAAATAFYNNQKAQQDAAAAAAFYARQQSAPINPIGQSATKQSSAPASSTLTSSLEAIKQLIVTRDFKGGIFGLREDDKRLDALFQFRDSISGLLNRNDLTTSLNEITRLIQTRDFRGGILGLSEDDSRLTKLFQFRDSIASMLPAAQSAVTQMSAMATQQAKMATPSSTVASSLEAIKQLIVTRDFKGGIFGMKEDDSRFNALFQFRDSISGLLNRSDLATSLNEIVRLIQTRDFRGGILGMKEDDPRFNALFAFRDSIESALGIKSPSKYFDWVGEMSAKGFSNGFNRALEIAPASSGASVNNSRTTSNQIVVQVQTTGNVVQDIRNQVELYALTFGAT